MPSARTIDALQALIPRADDCSDGELLGRYSCSHDGSAFAELVRRHGPMVYGTCRRIAHNGADADDAFQATFFILARKARSIHSSGAVASWLHSVAVKVAHKAQQQAIKRRERQMAAAKPEAVYPAAPVADWWAVVDDELSRLPEVLRQVILACDIGGQSRSKASRELGWPEGTVAKRLSKARQELAKRLARRGITLSVAALSAGLAAEATASVPSRLLAETIGQAAAYAVESGVGSVAVRTLAEGVMHSMKASVARIGAITGLVAMLLTGAGVMFAGGPTEPPPKKADPPKGVVETGGAKGDGIVWNEKTVLEAPGWLPASAAYSPDGKSLVVGGTGGKVFAVDAATHKKLWEADAGGNFAAVACSPDGKTVAATFTDGVRFLDASTGRAGDALEEKDSSPTAVAYFQDKASGDDPGHPVRQVIFGNARGYFIKTWLEWPKVSTITTSTTPGDKEPTDPNAVPLAVDPRNVAETHAVITGPIDRATGKNVLWAYACGGPGSNHVLEGHQATVVSAAWSNDGKIIVTGDASGRVIGWDAKSMKETRRLEFGRRVAALAVTADGRQIAAVAVGKQAEFYVWEAAKPANNMKPIHVDVSDFAGPVRAGLAFSPDGRQLAGTVYNAVWLNRLGELVGKVHVWERANPRAEAKPPEQPKPAELTWKLDPPITDPQFDLRSVAMSPDGKEFAVCSARNTVVYETSSGTLQYIVSGRFARFVGDDLYTWAHTASRIDAKTGKVTKQFPPAATRNMLFSAQVSPDGRKIAGFDGTVVRLIDLTTGVDAIQLAGQGKQIRNYVNTFPTSEVRWSRDGKRIVGVYAQNEAGGDGGLAIWDAETGKQVVRRDKTPADLRARIMCFDLSPSGKMLVVGGLARDKESNSSLTLLDAATLKPLQNKSIDSRDGGADVTAVAFAPDGLTVAAAVNLHSGKGPLVRVLLWNPATGDVQHLMPEHDTPIISSLAFSPDGKTLVAATGSILGGPQSKEVLHRILIWRGEPKKK